MTTNASKAPERIWLQLDLIARQPVEDATWCQDRIEDWDTEYVRRDLFDAMQAENERLRGFLETCQDEIDAYIQQEYPLDHPVHERYRQRDYAANPARAALEKDSK